MSGNSRTILGVLAVVAWFSLVPHRLCGADWAAVTAAAKPAVVFIKHRDANNRQSTGTGFFISPNGYILTCAHVVSPGIVKLSRKPVAASRKVADKIWTRTSEGVTREAQRVYCDGTSDIALLATGGSGFPWLGMSRSLPTQGEEVVLLGYPLGQALGKELVATRGIVSALRLDGEVFQLDAAANPGNSGGPVVNSYGQVVGVAFAKLEGLEGMNFAVSAAAIPSTMDMIARSPLLVEWIWNAVGNNDVDLVKAYLAIKPSLARSRHEDGRPVLSMVSTPEMAALLIGSGADVNARVRDGSTPLHWAATSGQPDICKMLMENGADVNARARDGWTPLHWAAMSGHPDVCKMLIDKGADVNARATDGWTPLHWAAMSGHPDVCKMLIDKSADVNARDTDGWTPLHMAASQGRTDTVRLLTDNGADVNSADASGSASLHYAAMGGRTAIVESLLGSGARADVVNKHGRTPLFLAAMHGHTSVAKLLLAKGARVNIRDKIDKWTPLSEAQHGHHRDMVKLLRAYGGRN